MMKWLCTRVIRNWIAVDWPETSIGNRSTPLGVEEQTEVRSMVYDCCAHNSRHMLAEQFGDVAV